MSISIRISEENHKRLTAISGKLRSELGTTASINDAIDYLCKKKGLADLAGAWEMTDAEARQFKKDLQKGWDKWNKRFA